MMAGVFSQLSFWSKFCKLVPEFRFAIFFSNDWILHWEIAAPFSVNIRKKLHAVQELLAAETSHSKEAITTGDHPHIGPGNAEGGAHYPAPVRGQDLGGLQRLGTITSTSQVHSACSKSTKDKYDS